MSKTNHMSKVNIFQVGGEKEHKKDKHNQHEKVCRCLPAVAVSDSGFVIFTVQCHLSPFPQAAILSDVFLHNAIKNGQTTDKKLCRVYSVISLNSLTEPLPAETA